MRKFIKKSYEEHCFINERFSDNSNNYNNNTMNLLQVHISINQLCLLLVALHTLYALHPAVSLSLRNKDKLYGELRGFYSATVCCNPTMTLKSENLQRSLQIEAINSAIAAITRIVKTVAVITVVAIRK